MAQANTPIAAHVIRRFIAFPLSAIPARLLLACTAILVQAERCRPSFLTVSLRQPR
jgi:hypothetical protein